MTQPTKRKSWIIPILLLALALLLAKPILRGIGDFLIVSDELQKADLITALSGAEYRTAYASELCAKHLAPKMFLTGGYNELDARYDSEWAKYIATTYGVPAGDIYTDEASLTSTYEEAKHLKAFLDAHPGEFNTIIVVTDAYHTRRARWAYEQVLGDEVTILMAPVPFDQAGYTSSWWRFSASRQMVAQEYFKYVFYRFRYQWTSGFFQDWLAKFDRF